MNHLTKMHNAAAMGAVILLSIACSVSAATLEFSGFDSYGRTVSSEDYKGVPLFLEFGACW